jgi:hypothetical protein
MRWQDQGRRSEEVARELRQTQRESLRPGTVRGRKGEPKEFWALRKSGRRKR